MILPQSEWNWYLIGKKPEEYAYLRSNLSNGKRVLEMYLYTMLHFLSIKEVLKMSSVFRLPTSDFHLPSSGFRLSSSVLQLPSSNFRLPSSFFRLPSSVFRLPSSDFRLPISDFLLPSSVFRLPTSGFRLPSFSIPPRNSSSIQNIEISCHEY